MFSGENNLNNTRQGNYTFRTYNGIETTQNSYNIYWGNRIHQTINGLMPGKYRLSAWVGLIDDARTASGFECYDDEYARKVFLMAKVNDSSKENSIAFTEYDKLQKLSVDFEVGSDNDNLTISICGSTHKYTVSSKYASAVVPYYVDNVEIELLSGAAACYTFNDTDVEVSFMAGSQNVYEKVTFNRTIKAEGYWNTLCLPFSLNETATSSLFSEVRELSSIAIKEGNNAVLKFKTANSIVAGKSYLVKTNTQITQIVKDSTTLELMPDKTQVSSENDEVAVSFVGTYGAIFANELPAGSFILQKNSFFSIDGMTADQKIKTRIKGSRGYFTTAGSNVEISHQAPSLRIGEDEEDENGSDIEAIVENEADSRIYNMCGQRLNAAPASGIYFVNGKKYIKK